MEKRVSFAPKLSLKELALRRVVVNLWNEVDVLASIPGYRIEELSGDGKSAGFLIDTYGEKWRVTVENKVKNKVAKLTLPESLKKRMMFIVGPVGFQLQQWYIPMDKYLKYSKKESHIPFLKELSWTSTGTINYQKTAEKQVNLQTLGILIRFWMTCYFCVADAVSGIWRELPEHYKRCFDEEAAMFGDLGKDLEFYWVYVLKGEESKLDERVRAFFGPDYINFCQYAFETSAYQGNKAATEYFFQKLTGKEQEDSLVKTVCKVAVKLCDRVALYGRFEVLEIHLSDVLCYLLSAMSPEQQMQALRKNRTEILNCFLDWPGQELYFDIADVTFPQEI